MNNISRRVSNSEFIKRVKNKCGNRIILLSKYINSKTPIKYKCTICGHVGTMSPNHLVERGRCPVCSRRNKGKKAAKTHKLKYIHKLHIAAGAKYTFLDKYTKSRTRIRIQNNTTGKIFSIIPAHFLQSHLKNYHYRRYPDKITTNKFIQRVFKHWGHTITVLGTYKNSNTKILCKCDKGDIFKNLPINIIRYGCPICVHRLRIIKVNRKLTHQFKHGLQTTYHGKIKLLGHYKNYCTKTWFLCNHGHYFQATKETLDRGKGCPICRWNRLMKRRGQRFLKALRKTHREVKPLESYRGANIKIWFQCPHGHLFKATPDLVKHGSGCPYCSSSRGERAVAWFLKIHHIKYIHSYHLHTAKQFLSRLHLDFYLPIYRIGIEFDGIQHFTPDDFTGKQSWHQTLVQWEELIFRDARKDKYCKKHNIHLIRIANKNSISDYSRLCRLSNRILSKKLLPLIK